MHLGLRSRSGPLNKSLWAAGRRSARRRYLGYPGEDLPAASVVRLRAAAAALRRGPFQRPSSCSIRRTRSLKSPPRRLGGRVRGSRPAEAFSEGGARRVPRRILLVFIRDICISMALVWRPPAGSDVPGRKAVYFYTPQVALRAFLNFLRFRASSCMTNWKASPFWGGRW